MKKERDQKLASMESDSYLIRFLDLPAMCMKDTFAEMQGCLFHMYVRYALLLVGENPLQIWQ